MSRKMHFRHTFYSGIDWLYHTIGVLYHIYFCIAILLLWVAKSLKWRTASKQVNFRLKIWHEKVKARKRESDRELTKKQHLGHSVYNSWHLPTALGMSISQSCQWNVEEGHLCSYKQLVLRLYESTKNQCHFMLRHNGISTYNSD